MISDNINSAGQEAELFDKCNVYNDIDVYHWLFFLISDLISLQSENGTQEMFER